MTTLSKRMNRHQQQLIEYLQEKVSVLKERYGNKRLDRDTMFYDYESVTYRIDPTNPATAGFSGAGAGRVTIDKAGRKIEIQTAVDVESDAENFKIKVHRTISEDGIVKGDKTFTRTIPRDFQ